MSWARGETIAGGFERLVPASRVYTPYRAPTRAECLMQSTSTGAACHVDRTRATLAGLYECIERDAVMIAWLNRLPLPRLEPRAVIADQRVAAVLGWLAGADFTVALLDATTDVGVPTVMCVLYGPDGTAPAAAVGAATRANVTAAAEKALIESAHTFFWIHTRYRDRRPAFRDDFADVTSLDLHSLRYGDPDVRDRLAFLCGDVPPAVRTRKHDLAASAAGATCRGDVTLELDRCVAALTALGMEPVVLDLTPCDVATRGFTVVRVVVPDLHPLWGGHHLRCLGGERVHAVPIRLGYRDQPLGPDALNADPHPMP
jgi:ribosomal protein S12 methylthiotransferase accessory factor